MQDETEGALRMLELGNDPPHDILDHPLPRNLFMASLWIGSGGPFLLYVCKQGGGGICQKLMQYYGFISNNDIILHNGRGRGKKAGILCKSYTMWMVNEHMAWPDPAWGYM